jgi:heme/copper-type cytochrome/quinol oxidase subunit 2
LAATTMGSALVMPTIGTSLFLIAAGAILRYAVTATVEGVSLTTVGLILMIVGIAGLVLGVLFLLVWSPWRAHVARDRVTKRERGYDSPLNY